MKRTTIGERFDRWYDRSGRANDNFMELAEEAFLAGRSDALKQSRPTVVIKHLCYKTAGNIDQFQIKINDHVLAIFYGIAGPAAAIEYATRLAKALKVKVRTEKINGSPR